MHEFTCSDFFHIFDVDWFISTLLKDVAIVKRVPDKVMRSMEKPPYTMRVPRKSTPDYYLDQVLPILFRRKVSTILSAHVLYSFCGCLICILSFSNLFFYVNVLITCRLCS